MAITSVSSITDVSAIIIEAGVVGPGARALGAARLPMYSRLLLDQSVLTNGMG